MYKKFFGLRDVPFNVSPDPRCFFPTRETQKALACMTYGIQERRGFVLLTGEVGTGKTTLINKLLDGLRGESVTTAFVFDTALNTTEFLDYVMADFGIKCESTLKSQMLWHLDQWLLERYKADQTAVLVVDEAQNLSTQMLEEIRMLTNLETYDQKLLQIVLSGQPELEERLKEPQLRQLGQRITLRAKTYPLAMEETHGYITERLRLAGADGRPIFTQEAINMIYRYSQGIQRVINCLCEHALICAYADQHKLVARETIDQVARRFELDMVEPLMQRLSRNASVDRVGENTYPVSPQEVDVRAKAGPSLAFGGSRAGNADYFEARQRVEGAEAKEKSHRNLGVASVPSSPVGMKEPPLAIPHEPSASPLKADPPRAEQPVSARVGQQLTQRLFLQLFLQPRPRVRKVFPLVFAFVTLAITGGVGGISYFLRYRHPGWAADRNLPAEFAAVEGKSETVAAARASAPVTTLPEMPPTLESRNTSKASEGKPRPDAPSEGRQITRPEEAALSDPRIVTPTRAKHPRAQVGRMVVSANVEGARISVDGRTDPGWVTPYTFSAVPSGTHRVVLSKEGYEDAYLRLTVKPGSKNRLKAELMAPVGLISIVTNPPGLEVYIDGRPSGPSPVEAMVAVGEHTYTVKRAGFEDYHGKFTVKNGSIITRKLDFGGT